MPAANWPSVCSERQTVSETVRLALGIPSAALIAWCAPPLQRSWWRGAFAAVFGAWVLWPAFDGVSAILLLVSVIGAAMLPVRRGSDPSDTDAATTDSRQRRGSIRAAVLASIAALTLSFAGAIVATDRSHTWQLVRSFLRDRHEVVVYVSGFGVATLVAGSVIAFFLRPLQEELANKGEALSSLTNAGTYIGWLERAVFFGLFVAGEPAAAALALTAKSIARFPTLPDHKEGFAEYFLIGTLLSVALSAAAAVGVRLVLGLPALK